MHIRIFRAVLVIVSAIISPKSRITRKSHAPKKTCRSLKHDRCEGDPGLSLFSHSYYSRHRCFQSTLPSLLPQVCPSTLATHQLIHQIRLALIVGQSSALWRAGEPEHVSKMRYERARATSPHPEIDAKVIDISAWNRNSVLVLLFITDRFSFPSYLTLPSCLHHALTTIAVTPSPPSPHHLLVIVASKYRWPSWTRSAPPLWHRTNESTKLDWRCVFFSCIMWRAGGLEDVSDIHYGRARSVSFRSDIYAEGIDILLWGYRCCARSAFHHQSLPEPCSLVADHGWAESTIGLVLCANRPMTRS